jgi:hypothetical protein
MQNMQVMKGKNIAVCRAMILYFCAITHFCTGMNGYNHLAGFMWSLGI